MTQQGLEAWAQRLHAVAAALGVPAATATRLVADCVACHDDARPAADSVTMPLADTALVARLEARAGELGVPADLLGLMFIALGIERLDVRARGRRWASDTVGLSHWGARRAGQRAGLGAPLPGAPHSTSMLSMMVVSHAREWVAADGHRDLVGP